MIEDTEHVLWMGSYGGGLVRMKDSNIVRYTYSNGLSNDVILKILEDDNSNLWMSSIKGISFVSKHMLNDFANGKIDHIHCTAYNSSDGMIVSECSTPTGCKTSDGRLWFPTPRGIVVVDPNHIPKNILPPPVVIEQVTINNKDYSPYASIQILQGDGQAEFHYGGMSFIAPEKVYFRYMLEGFDTDWKTVGTRHTAFYTNLPTGKYNFRVTACNNDGIWNEAGASFAFELRPHFYQTSWFYSLLLIAFGASLFSVYRLRVWSLLKRKKELEQHVFDRTLQLETANKELEAFAYSVSHDLRAPLRAIDGYVRMLAEDYEKYIDDKGKHICSVINNETKHMDRLIDDLLTLSRIGYKEIKMANIDMEKLVHAIFVELVPAEQRQRIDLHIDHLPAAVGDPTLIREVWMNLLSNAIKFSSKRERAVIDIGFKQEGQRIIYYIRDNGAGFDMRYAERLFGVFQRLHSEKEFEGTGVGLALVQRLIHRHGGTIWATSVVDQGTTFFFTLSQRGLVS
jgi:signal transduction histidine kinase